MPRSVVAARSARKEFFRQDRQCSKFLEGRDYLFRHGFFGLECGDDGAGARLIFTSPNACDDFWSQPVRRGALRFGSYQGLGRSSAMRRPRVRSGRDPFAGCLEADENYIGGEEKDVRGRQTESKAIVAIAVEGLEPKRFDRARLPRIADGWQVSRFIYAAGRTESEVPADRDGSDFDEAQVQEAYALAQFGRCAEVA